MRKRRVTPTDIDALIHNRRTSCVLVLEGKPEGWEPAAYDGQMEALRSLLSVRTRVYVVRADWPQGKLGPVMDAGEAIGAKRPASVDVANVKDWVRGKARGLNWKTMTYDAFLLWLAEGWE